MEFDFKLGLKLKYDKVFMLGEVKCDITCKNIVNLWNRILHLVNIIYESDKDFYTKWLIGKILSAEERYKCIE